jgi:hypothetical protein
MLDSGDAHVAMGRGTLASMFRLMEHAATTSKHFGTVRGAVHFGDNSSAGKAALHAHAFMLKGRHSAVPPLHAATR